MESEKTSTGKFIGFALMDCFYWGFYASFGGFCSTYLLACGMSPSVLSIVLAGFMACAFLGAFFWGGMCDRAGSNRKVFLPEFAMAFLLAMVIYFMADKNIMVSAVLYPLFGFLCVPLGSNLDAWMLKGFERDATVFGRARSLGSAGYAVVMLMEGRLIASHGYSVIPMIATTIAILCLFLAFFNRDHATRFVRTSITPGDPRDLLAIKPYMILIVILFLSGVAMSPINNLKIVILESVGGDVSVLGLDAFLGVMVQAGFLFISGSLRKIPTYARLFIATLFVLAMTSLTFLAVSSFMIILGTVCNNISYGLLLPTMREITEENIEGTLKNTAHSLTDAMFGSFAGVVALLYSGTLMDRFGARRVALLGMGIMVIPVTLSLFMLLKKKQ